MQEQANYRRRLILHVLRQNPGGLQQMQILAQIQQSEFMLPAIPANKALIKADVEEMNGKQIRRVGNSKKWEAI
jgi:hypothetical protein